jgi:hypothetical protein
MSRNRSSAKKAGSSFERSIADYFRDNWDDRIDRRVKTGAVDKGDIANFRINTRRIVIECKNETKYDFNNAVNEARTEGLNDGALVGFAVVKRHGKADPAEQFVVSTVGDFVNFLRGIGASP